MRIKKRLTEREFETLRPSLSRLKERNVDAVRLILVEGLPQKDVAAQLGVTTKAVSQLVSNVWQAHIDRGDRPEGWVSVNVSLPPDLAEMVKDLERKARAKLIASKK